jgi:hypothetical protein
MAGSGPTIVAKFVADTSNLTKGVDSAATQNQNRLSSFAKTAAITIGGAFAATAVINFGKDAIAAATADAEAQAKLAQTLKNVTGATDDQIAASEDYISNLSKQAAIADDDLRPALDKLVRGFGNTEDAQKALTLATDVSAGTGKDLAAVTDAMMKAAQGNTGALKKMGVEVKNADGSAKSLDEIMASMAKTFDGQASVAANTTAGKMRNASIQFGEFQEQIGAAVLPMLGALAGFLTGTLIPALSSVADWLAGHKDVIAAALIAVGTIVGAVVIPSFIAWATAAGAAAIATIAAAAPFIAIGAVIAGVAFLIIHNWDTIVDVSKATWDAVTGAVKTAFNWVKDNWPLLLAIITGPIGAAVLVVVNNWDTIKGAAVAVWDWFNNTWHTLTDIITGPFQSSASAIVGIWDSIVSGVKTAISSVVDAIKTPINAVIRAWNGLEFKIPSVDIPQVHIPGLGDIGGGSIGGQTIGFPDIATLGRGGVLTSPTLFVGGEAGTEIVTPESLLRQILREEGGGNTYQLNMYPRTADAADVAYGFRRLELMAGVG